MESIGWSRRKVGRPVSDGPTQQRLRLSCCRSDGHAVTPRSQRQSRRTAQKTPFSTNALTAQVTATPMVAFYRRSGTEPSCAEISRATASTIPELRCGQAECTKASHSRSSIVCEKPRQPRPVSHLSKREPETAPANFSSSQNSGEGWHASRPSRRTCRDDLHMNSNRPIQEGWSHQPS